MNGDLHLVGWRRLRTSSQVGLADVVLPIGLTIHRCPVFENAGRRWATLPSPPPGDQPERSRGPGRPRLDDNGGQIVSWKSPKLRNAFSDAVVSLVLERDPGAFADVL